MNPKHTARCQKIVSPQAASLPVMALVMEKASTLWLLLSPLVWSLKNRQYVIGVDRASRSLCLYRYKMGLFGPKAGTAQLETIPAAQLQAPEFSDGMLTGQFRFTKPDGVRLNLFVPKPSKANAKEVFQMLQEARGA